MLRDFRDTILPGITHWNHPGFFAYFANSGSYPGILGELLAAGLNANGMLWVTSPAVTELEQVSLDWLRQQALAVLLSRYAHELRWWLAKVKIFISDCMDLLLLT
jgi:glutamate/tyrosine decarboxylase-like PLP-dependent enzyme